MHLQCSIITGSDLQIQSYENEVQLKMKKRHQLWRIALWLSRFKLRPRPHVSGDFCISKFFYADTKISAPTRSVYESYTTVHTYPIRIRTSQRISQQSMRIKTGSDTVTSAYTKIYEYERPHVSGYTAYTEISTMESVYRNLRIHRAYAADTCGRYIGVSA